MNTFLQNKKSELPVRSQLLSQSEFNSLCDCPAELLQELLAIGWVAPAQSAQAGDLFVQADVYRIRKLKRICNDFEVNTVGGTIIVDLLNRIDELEQRIKELQDVLHGR